MISVKFILKAVMWISLQTVPQSAKLNVSSVLNYVKQDLSVKTVSENSLWDLKWKEVVTGFTAADVKTWNKILRQQRHKFVTR